jgi:8-oxo-dGTP diphosphatase
MTEPADFHGTKVAIFVGDDILVYRRDAKVELSFPDMWDLPGGGRENGESGGECCARETYEEFGLVIAPADFDYIKPYPNWRGGDSIPALFYVTCITLEDKQNIRFGDEGQYWQLMPAQAFVDCGDAVPHLQDQLREYLITLA